jgi:hypothetical protein
VPQRQDELEAAAPRRLRLELDAATERGRELVRDRQAEARAGVVARPERPEDALPLLRSDADSWSSTRPPSGVQRKAFERRFEMICSTRSPSETIVGLASKRLSYSIPRRRASSPKAT